MIHNFVIYTGNIGIMSQQFSMYLKALNNILTLKNLFFLSGTFESVFSSKSDKTIH